MDDKEIFDDVVKNLVIEYTLPVIAHSVGVATRTPTAGYGQHHKFMPDYGGALDLPGKKLKNYSLVDGKPFKIKSQNQKIIITNKNESHTNIGLISEDSFVATRYLDSTPNDQISTLKAIGENLFINSIENIDNDQTDSPNNDTQLYGQLCFDEDISGLKHTNHINDHLIVKFPRRVKTLRLERSYDLSNGYPDDIDPYEIIVSLSEKSSFNIKDSCLNPFNKSIQAIASEIDNQYQVKFYDITKSRQHFHKISWESDVANINPPTVVTSRNTSRSQTYYPLRNSEEVQQLSNIPSHLVNLHVATSFNVALIDPRLQRLGQVYVKKAQLVSAYPIEEFERLEYSAKNDYQFYCLSNVFLRVFDTRYPGLPVNQVNHMLGTIPPDRLNIKLVDKQCESKEILTISNGESLCFISFDHDKTIDMINPKSLHQPFHSANPWKIENQSTRLYGLSTESDRIGYFRILQMDAIGDIVSRKFEFISKHEQESNLHDCDMDDIIAEINTHTNENLTRDRISCRRFDERERNFTEDVEFEEEFLNIFDTNALIELEDKIESTRARDRFNKMKEKLDAP